VAVNSSRKGSNGDQVERTVWFRTRMGGGRGDYVARELRKGSRVLVRGRLEIGEWTTREGEVRISYDIWADDVVNLSQRDGSPREDGPAKSRSLQRREPSRAPSTIASSWGTQRTSTNCLSKHPCELARRRPHSAAGGGFVLRSSYRLRFGGLRLGRTVAPLFQRGGL